MQLVNHYFNCLVGAETNVSDQPVGAEVNIPEGASPKAGISTRAEIMKYESPNNGDLLYI